MILPISLSAHLYLPLKLLKQSVDAYTILQRRDANGSYINAF
jgi:hypothetical protein